MITFKQLQSLEDKEFRHLYVSDQIREMRAAQIRELRESRGWSQERLGEETGMAQGRVSLLEDPNYLGVTPKTLKRVGEAFDVALLQEYVSFRELLERIEGKERLSVPSYDEDLATARTQGIVYGQAALSSVGTIIMSGAGVIMGGAAFTIGPIREFNNLQGDPNDFEWVTTTSQRPTRQPEVRITSGENSYLLAA